MTDPENAGGMCAKFKESAPNLRQLAGKNFDFLRSPVDARIWSSSSDANGMESGFPRPLMTAVLNKVSVSSGCRRVAKEKIVPMPVTKSA